MISLHMSLMAAIVAVDSLTLLYCLCLCYLHVLPVLQTKPADGLTAMMLYYSRASLLSVRSAMQLSHHGLPLETYRRFVHFGVNRIKPTPRRGTRAGRKSIS